MALVIRRLKLGEHALCLYGRSGGAHLIHQYFTLYPKSEARVFLQAAVNHELDAQWGVSSDHFWEELSGNDPAMARSLLSWLGQRPARRRDLVLVLQWQHFFESLEALPSARRSAIRAFLDADWKEVAALRLRSQSAEVLQVAGRLDHTCDYRTQIGLNGLTQGSTLLILDDDLVFKRWTATGAQSRLLRTYLLNGSGSAEFRRQVASLGQLHWRERGGS